jgi:hypothetical protein
MPGRSIPVTKTLGNNFEDRFLRNAPGFACPKAIEIPIKMPLSGKTHAERLKYRLRSIEVPFLLFHKLLIILWITD